MTKNDGFDPFAFDKTHARMTRSWLFATGVQALVTCGLLGLSRLAEGGPDEACARVIVCLGIVATWSLALRTIRERLLQLIGIWQKASRGLLKRASESGRHWVHAPLKPEHERYIKAAIRRLRIIAAGLTIPFFIMPLTWTFISVFLSFKGNEISSEAWASAACFMLFSAVIVASYFHWSIVPLPQPTRVRTARSKHWKQI